jgi:hypothetical protein
LFLVKRCDMAAGTPPRQGRQAAAATRHAFI